MNHELKDSILKIVRTQTEIAFTQRDKEKAQILKRLLDSLEIRYEKIIGESVAIKKVFTEISKIATSPLTTVLLLGESGSGKRLVARAIHDNSARKNAPFITVNCATIPENLLEDDLFGHEKGAFTGAVQEKQGKFEIANNGTIFLDEIGDMQPFLQAKLLRVVQEKEFERVGGIKRIKVEVRIIAATNQNLEEKMKKGEFREDLYYRLNVFPIKVPPLRERKEDIPVLIRYFISEHAKKCRKEKVRDISEDAQNLLMKYYWHGNVRELENVIERAVINCNNDVISIDALPDYLKDSKGENTKENIIHLLINENFSIPEIEVEMIKKALSLEKGNQSEAARMLGISQRKLSRMIKKLEKGGHEFSNQVHKKGRK